jgi:hypothetical protein
LSVCIRAQLNGGAIECRAWRGPAHTAGEQLLQTSICSLVPRAKLSSTAPRSARESLGMEATRSNAGCLRQLPEAEAAEAETQVAGGGGRESAFFRGRGEAAETASASQHLLASGQRVRIDGLNRALQYNGLHATIKELLSDGNVIVVLDRLYDKNINVKPENVIVIGNKDSLQQSLDEADAKIIAEANSLIQLVRKHEKAGALDRIIALGDKILRLAASLVTRPRARAQKMPCDVCQEPDGPGSSWNDCLWTVWAGLMKANQCGWNAWCCKNKSGCSGRNPKMQRGRSR